MRNVPDPCTELFPERHFSRQIISFILFAALSPLCVKYHAHGAYAISHTPPTALILPSRGGFNSYYRAFLFLSWQEGGNSMAWSGSPGCVIPWGKGYICHTGHLQMVAVAKYVLWWMPFCKVGSSCRTINLASKESHLQRPPWPSLG